MKSKLWRHWGKAIMYVLAAVSCFYVGSVFAATGDTLGTVAVNISNTLTDVAKLVVGISYVAGLGFAVGAVLKFKAHKDNPTQIPVGTPLALLFVAAALLFLPSLLKISGQTIFGTSAKTGNPSGFLLKEGK